MKELVKIACKAAGTIELDDLNELQGNLKILSAESYDRLKHSIGTYGFSFPVHAWKDPKGKAYILDATQRTRALRKMRDEGWVVPKLPVAWVSAKDRKEATRKLLAAASQYGEVTPDGLHDFMKKFDIEMADMLEGFKFPEINFSQFEQSYFPDTKNVSFTAKQGSKELSESDFDEFQHTCPKCGFGFN